MKTTEIPILTERNLDSIVAFVDPNGDGIDLSELENAFKIVMMASSHSKMDPAAVTAMKKLKGVMRKRKMGVNALMNELDASGDGEVSRDEIAGWLGGKGMEEVSERTSGNEMATATHIHY